MPVVFKDAAQERDVNLILDDLLATHENSLRHNDIVDIVDYIVHNPLGDRMPADRAGKVFEVIFEIFPNLLAHIDAIPEFMFFGSDFAEVNIPVNIQKIGQAAFAESEVRTINYDGTEAQWHDLVRRSSRGWDILNRNRQVISDVCVVNCSDKNDIYAVNLEEALVEAMTSREVLFKRNVLNYLREDGFNTFAEYLDHFHFNFWTSKEAGQPFVAAISPEKGVVLINPEIDADAISMVLRHEAAHHIFKHMEHMFAKLKEMGIDTPSELAYRLSNIAGDYHISNTIYDEADKYIAKHLKIEGGEEVAGLVTELDFPEHPEYWTMDFDQLWDIFVKDYKDKKEELDKKAQEQSNENEQEQVDPEFAEGWNALIDAYNAGEITKEQVKQWYDAQQGK